MNDNKKLTDAYLKFKTSMFSRSKWTMLIMASDLVLAISRVLWCRCKIPIFLFLPFILIFIVIKFFDEGIGTLDKYLGDHNGKKR